MTDFLKLQRKAERKFQAITRLSANGTAKDKRKLNETWTNRESKNLRGFWNDKHTV